MQSAGILPGLNSAWSPCTHAAWHSIRPVVCPRTCQVLMLSDCPLLNAVSMQVSCHQGILDTDQSSSVHTFSMPTRLLTDPVYLWHLSEAFCRQGAGKCFGRAIAWPLSRCDRSTHMCVHCTVLCKGTLKCFHACRGSCVLCTATLLALTLVAMSALHADLLDSSCSGFTTAAIAALVQLLL
jgi:hypothetical protein